MKKPKPKSIFRKKNTALKTVHGILDITRYGMGFVEVPGMDRDILIRRDYLQGAMKGDEVEVAVFTPTGTKRAEGRIIKIIKRSQTECIGTVQKNAGFAFVVPDNSEFNRDIYISSEGSRPLKDGDRVWVRITDWSERMKNPEGEIIEVLDPEKQRDADMKEILLQAGFPLRFPADVMQESEALSMPSGPLPENRKDYRDVLTFTIDPEDARDFDDALSIKTLRRGVYEIGVHIADVSHFLEEGSALDLEAKKRATSVYLPDRVLPMLPERISNELCSLRPHEDRFTFSVLFEITEEAEVLNFQLCKTCIHSNRRFTYEEVQHMLDGSEGDYRNELLILNALSQKLRKEKMSKGAINFASEEIRFVLDEKGNPIGVKVKESLASHQLIEEWMLLANRTVSELASAKKWKNKAVPFPYRVHDIPDMDKLKSFALFAARFGHRFDLSSPEQIAHSFNRMIQQSAHEPSQQFLHTLGIRTMAKAHYTTGNIGHYGLGFEFYSHFTSPIRRYPDVLSHRILLALLENRSPLIHDLEAVCMHCSERERKAMEAERSAMKYMQVVFLSNFLGEEFDALISGVSAFGFWAQTLEHRCEGFVSIRDLSEWDDFVFIEEEYALQSRNGKYTFRMGDLVRIQVAATHVTKKQIDFQWVFNEQNKKQKAKRPDKKNGRR